MENDSAFLLTGPSYAIVAATTPPTAIQIDTQLTGAQRSYRIYNAGTVDIGLSYAATAALAATNAVLPTSGSPQQCMVVPGGKVETITASPGQYWTAVSASSTATVYIGAGYGRS